jgi:DNA-binding HxlR family transcriptional regulator
MPVKRSYAECGDACATAHAVELIGDRWTYPVIRELMLAPKRFGELADAVLGVTPAVLTSRLREMEAAGLVERVTLPAPASVSAYRLTPWARELGPLLRSLGRWAHGSPLRDAAPTGGLTPDGVVQSMLTMAPAEAPSPGLELQLELTDARVEGGHSYTYRLSWDEAGLRIDRGTHPGATATLRADSSALAGMLYQTHELPPGQQDMVTGDNKDVARLLDAFPTP